MIVLKKELLDIVIAQAKREFPNEACGIFAGKDGRVEKVYEMTNVDKSPSSYFMDAKEQLQATKDMRKLGLEMVGIYHSHVTSDPRPSAHDVEMAFYPGASYVIISLKDRDRPSIKSFRIQDKRISEEEIKII